jgi:hypothetical protein
VSRPRALVIVKCLLLSGFTLNNLPYPVSHPLRRAALVTPGGAKPVCLRIQHRVQRLFNGPTNHFAKMVPDPGPANSESAKDSVRYPQAFGLALTVLFAGILVLNAISY